MTPKSIVVAFCLVVLFVSGSVLAQDQPRNDKQQEEETFNLSTTGTADVDLEAEEEEEVAAYVPRIEPGKFEIALTLGYMGLSKTLLQHDQIIYKATDELYYYGDVDLKGKSAFAPVLHLDYNLTSWFALEAKGTISFTDYLSDITNRSAVSPEGGTPETDPEFGEFDRESRSVLAFIADLNAVWYPLNMGGSRESRWHPYLTGGLGQAIYNIDSNYTDETASGFDFNIGAGVRLIADDLVSLRVEVVQHFHDIEFTPAEFFDVYNDGTVRVPVYEFDEVGQYDRVESFESQALGSLVWSIGIVASF